MKDIKTQLLSFSKQLVLVGLSSLMFTQAVMPNQVLAAATPKTTTFSSELSDNLFEVAGFGDLVIGAVKSEDGTVAWCINKTKPFPHADGIVYNNNPDEANWSWDINGIPPTQDQIKKIKNVVYANNYVFRKQLADYGLDANDTMSLYHASQIANWSIAEGWTPTMVKKQAETIADPNLNALADKIYSLYVDIYNYASDLSNKTYVEGATLWNYEDPQNLVKIGTDITLSNAKVVQEVATGKRYFRSEKMYLIPNQNNGYVFDGDAAYTYKVTLGAGAPVGARIVNEYGVPQTEFSTRLSNPIGTNFYVEVPQAGVTAGNFTIEVETTKFIRENPMLYTPATQPQYQAIMQYYGASDHAKQTVKVNYPDGITKRTLGEVKILKKGEQLSGYVKSNSEYGSIYSPVFEVLPLKGSAFELAYKNTITCSGTATCIGGDVIFGQPIKTGQSGLIKVSSLGLDTNSKNTTFTVKEVEPAPGYTLGSNPNRELTISEDTGTVTEVKYVTENGNVIEQTTISNQIDFENKFIGLNFEIRKTTDTYGEVAGVPGVVFGIYTRDAWGTIPAKSLIGTITSDANGIVNNESLKLPAGRVYEIKELKAPLGYVIDTNTYTIDATITDTNKTQETLTIPVKDADGNTVTTITNFMDYFSVIDVTKSDLDNPALKLSGAEFGLYQEGKTTPLETGVTGANGVLVFTTKLGLGDYYIQEKVAPTNYIINTEKVTFKIQSPADDHVSLNVTNELKPVSIEVTKKDSDTKLPIQGVEFKIYRLSDTTLTTPLATLSTNAQGIVIFTNLKYGDYRIVETTLPTGYTGSLVNQAIELTKSPYAQTTKLDVFNTPFKATVRATKVDFNDASIRLIGAVYDLYKKDSNVVIATATSDSKGEMVFPVQVPFGDYYIKESVAPAGYQLNPEKIEFTLNSTTQNVITLTARDVKKFINIRIEKIDNADAKKYLEGAEFKIYHSSDTELKNPVKTVVTGSDGKVTIQGLPLGKYWLVETKSPNGYVLDKQKIVLDLEKLSQNETLVISVRNAKSTDEKTVEVLKPTITVEKPKTGEFGSSSALYIAGGVSLIGFAALIALKQRKKQTNE